MADWEKPLDSQTDPDAPITSLLGKRWDNNPIAMFEGAPGAPRLTYGALPRLTAGDVVRMRADEAGSLVAGANIGWGLCVAQAGMVRISWEDAGDGSSRQVNLARKRAGVLTTLSTFVTAQSAAAWNARKVDVSVLPGDVVGLQIPVGAPNIRNKRFSTGGEEIWQGFEGMEIMVGA